MLLFTYTGFVADIEILDQLNMDVLFWYFAKGDFQCQCILVSHSRACITGHPACSIRDETAKNIILKK